MPTPNEHELMLQALVRIESKADTALANLAALKSAQSALAAKIEDTQALVLQITRSLP